jgi:hypothetical protein
MASTGMEDLVDKHSIGKPSAFTGRESEWSERHFVFMSWVSMLSQQAAEDLRVARGAGKPLDLDDMSDEAKRRSAQFCHLLVMMVKGRVLDILRGIGQAWGAQR